MQKVNPRFNNHLTDPCREILAFLDRADIEATR